ncbi:hypothetical protein PMKS-002786 [Pichia membranifaciens]|uniref:Uncharacterized protein n=1 Tax=Pichia membranifaciens TaxID=4926 RepID=A0A1Q2YID0_9ASCO|nr:hypothetical protein PMKS-002786 [Pichia membranifaciens]
MDPDTRPRIYKSCLIRVGGFQDEHEEEDNAEEEKTEEEAPEQMEGIEEEAEEAEEGAGAYDVDEYMHVVEANEVVNSVNPSFWELPIEEGAEPEPEPEGEKDSGKGKQKVKAKAKGKAKEGQGNAKAKAKKKEKEPEEKRAPEFGAQPVEEEEMEEEIEETVDEEFRTPEQQQQLRHDQPESHAYPVTRQEQRIREELTEVQVARSSPNVDSPVEDRDAVHDFRTPKPEQQQHDVACILSSSVVVEADEDNADAEPSFSDEATKVEEPDNERAEQAGQGPPDHGKLGRTLVFNSLDAADDPIKSVLTRIVHETEARVAAMERELDAEHEAVVRDVQLHYEKLKTNARIEIAREINKDFFSGGLRQQGQHQQRPPAANGARMRDWPMRNEYYGIIPHYGRGREEA